MNMTEQGHWKFRFSFRQLGCDVLILVSDTNRTECVKHAAGQIRWVFLVSFYHIYLQYLCTQLQKLLEASSLEFHMSSSPSTCRLQSGMNLQICFVNDSGSDKDSDADDSKTETSVDTPLSPVVRAP